MTALGAFVATVALALGALVVGRHTDRAALLRDLAATGAVEVAPVPAEYRAWWDSTAACLGIKPRFPAHLRVFAGTRVPASMLADAEPDSGMYWGYANRLASIILLAPSTVANRAVVTHELWHLQVGYGHPPAIFPDNGPPVCGLAPG